MEPNPSNRTASPRPTNWLQRRVAEAIEALLVAGIILVVALVVAS